MVKLAIGTANAAKIEAVKESAQEYRFLDGAEIVSIAAPSGVCDQPLTIEETIKGAKNRAKYAFDAFLGVNYSFGIESGLMEAHGVETGYLEACICCIYDGQHYHIGLSCGFEIPPAILKLVFEKNVELCQACFDSGITDNIKLGSAEGLIGLLTKGRVTRKEYTKQCIRTAMIQIENLSWYR